MKADFSLGQCTFELIQGGATRKPKGKRKLLETKNEDLTKIYRMVSYEMHKMKTPKILEKKEVLKRTGLSIHSLRHYIKFFAGIVPGCSFKKALRGKRGCRAYYPLETVEMINKIRKEKQSGKKLAKIRIALQAEKALDKELKKRKLKRNRTIPVIVQISNPDFKAKIFIGEGEMEKGLTECLGEPEITITKDGKKIMRWRG